jgi:hypothetical protein
MKNINTTYSLSLSTLLDESSTVGSPYQIQDWPCSNDP